MKEKTKKNRNSLVFFIDFIIIKSIRVYQKTLSFDHGPLKKFYPHGYCRYYPTCSQYAIDAVNKYGFLKGIFKALWRVLRCNPWSKGGIDEA